MKNSIKKLAEKRDGFNEKLKNKLSALPPRARLNIILLMMALYLLITVAVLAGIVFGKEKNHLDIERIEPVKLIDSPIKSRVPTVVTPNDTLAMYIPNNKQ